MTEYDDGGEAYDYVIVGAGTAGCTIAARLSEEPSARVLLLEAGGATPLPAMNLPPAWPSLLGTPADWSDRTTPQDKHGTSVDWPRGKGIGGSSSTNGMCFYRGHFSSYDAWNVPGWRFDDLLPYFKRSEHAPTRDPVLRGSTGPLLVGPPTKPHPIAEAALGAAVEAGFRRAEDIGGGLEEGFGFGDMNIVAGQRQSASDAYLTPARDRSNLRIEADALVRRVVISHGRCTGVEYAKASGITRRARCVEGGTVVLTAGTVGTAQLLLLSGIGPAGHLRELGIPVAVDLPAVGENVHDHPMCGVVYASRRRVPDAVNNHGEVHGLIRTGYSSVDGPDVQALVIDLPLRAPTVPGPDVGYGYTIACSLMLPRSRGTIRLGSAVPGGATRIDPCYYADRRDIDAVAEGMRAVRRIGGAEALRPWRDVEAWPGADISDDDLHKCVPRNLRSYSHYAGSCRMGADDGSVVDIRLRVRGLEGLSIADASIMPGPVSANTNATVYAVAERAADLLRG
jgi:choline dehydrogenase